MADDITKFPKTPRRRVGPRDIEMIGFQTYDDQDCFIVDPDDIMVIMKCIVQNKIKLRSAKYEE